MARFGTSDIDVTSVMPSVAELLLTRGMRGPQTMFSTSDVVTPPVLRYNQYPEDVDEVINFRTADELSRRKYFWQRLWKYARYALGKHLVKYKDLLKTGQEAIQALIEHAYDRTDWDVDWQKVSKLHPRQPLPRDVREFIMDRIDRRLYRWRREGNEDVDEWGNVIN
jgi:hypothetical protein